MLINKLSFLNEEDKNSLYNIINNSICESEKEEKATCEKIERGILKKGIVNAVNYYY